MRRWSLTLSTLALTLALSGAGAQEVLDELPPETPPDVHVRLLDSVPYRWERSRRPRPGPMPRSRPGHRPSTCGKTGAGERFLWCLPEPWVRTPAERARPPSAQANKVLELRLHPRAGVHGKLRLSPRQPGELPSVAELRIDPCAERGQNRAPASLGSYPVVVAEDGVWASPVPAGCVHLTLSPEPSAGLWRGSYAALSWWGLGLEAGTTEALGTRTLQTGASVLMRVISGDDGLAVEGAVVELFAEHAIEAAWKAPGKSTSAPPAPEVIQRGTTGPWGWLRLAGLPPGVYMLRLLRPDGEFFTVTTPFDLSFREAVFDPLEIPVPARLILRLDPEAELPGTGQIEAGMVLRWQNSELRNTYRSSIGPRYEEIVLEGLHPGTWEVHLQWRGENQRNQIAHETVELAPGEELRLDLTLESSLYRGTVTFEGEAVQGTLTFQLRSEEPERLVRRVLPSSSSDEEGHFAVLLSGPGVYGVRVEWDRGLVTLPILEVGPPDEDLQIRLPEGRLEGRVVDLEGLPVTEASVFARRLDLGTEDLDPMISPTWGRSGEDGRFEISGLSEGTWEVHASKGELRSTTLDLPLGPDQVLPGIELVLGKPIQISGRVLTDTGRPVAGASGWLLLDARDGALLDLLRRFETDVQGRFQLELITSPRYPAHVMLSAAGLPSTAMRLPVTESMELVMPEVGGRVEILLHGDTSSMAGGGLLLQRLDGALLQPDLFRQQQPPLQQTQDRLVRVLPRLAPGTWRLLVIRNPEDGLRLIAGASLPPLATFEVLPGQTLVIEEDLSEP